MASLVDLYLDRRSISTECKLCRHPWSSKHQLALPRTGSGKTWGSNGLSELKPVLSRPSGACFTLGPHGVTYQ
eukprot:2028527-Pyramimonas_sp.AAC.1